MRTERQIDKWMLILLYLLAFVLLWEWLLPVMELTSSGSLVLFLLFVALFFLMALFNIKWWLAIPVKLLYILWAVHYIFFHELFFSQQALILLRDDFIANIVVLLKGQWEGISNPFRTMLFFALLWMTAYLIRYWIEVKKSILLFYVMTVVFIAFIDTFSPYSAEQSIFRIMVSGCLLLGLLTISRLAQKHRKPLRFRTYLFISIPLLLFVSTGGLLAHYLPKSEPVWPDPVPFVRAVVQGVEESGNLAGVTKSGYDPDDSKLGGSFVQDDTLIFEAKVADRQYWKIETKNTYTSKGWEQVSQSNEQTIYHMGDELHAINEDESLRTAELILSNPFPFVVYPYGLHKVHADDNYQLIKTNATGKYATVIANSNNTSYSAVELPSYLLEFEEHKYSLQKLRATKMEDFSYTTENLNPYLQLPDQLPSRVRELAMDIAGESESVYEKAKAIERYFARNGFVYAQQDIPVPRMGQDYVDQFLFETKRGYCDNFSTSMVVMLRSIGIPARWVKGFAPGEEARNADGEKIYRVTNNEAHSWVEAYMPGVGWMPFEPTIGFTNTADIEYDLDLNVGNADTQEKQEQRPQETETHGPKTTTKQDASFSSFIEALDKWFQTNTMKTVFFGFALLLVVSMVYVRRAKWLPALLTRWRRSESGDWEMFRKQYGSLLKQLDRIGLKRRHGTTLADYAKEVDRHFGGTSMSLLTIAYEKGFYGGETADHDWMNLQKIWEDLIKKTVG
ncbi:transglutaminase family protein [Sporosarcina sp. FSL W7-1349]|uniref:transglutaminase-like domain-containing protein n=1 Tax=Sporosarcina sp. FSL W7-1349 TaxID=2921561 RepID=UPI0030FAABFB